ncbi:MAG: pyruvate kinase [Candidatus Latescibacterota bacterium]|nr:MAG: pyruvate kinase [Candidatus Latescibacterota bacterium]
MKPDQRLFEDERPRQTKIVATVGPACSDSSQLSELLRRGVDVFRINTAHGKRSQHETGMEAIRRAGRDVGRPVAILVDLAGPKIRLGELAGGQLDCVAGASVRFVPGRTPAGPSDLVTTYEPLIDELKVGSRVMLADGTVALDVTDIEGNAATCTVVQPGVVRNGQGVNVPRLKLNVPALDEKDRETAAWAARVGVDFIGLSFVRSAEDVHDLKMLIEEHGSEARVIAKIEKPEALDNLEAIIEETDGVMIARGDLGVEIDIARVPIVQKRIIAACRRSHTPVIVATQMLDSMQHSRLPTRAEATDVANAILDGADACMLSGETAIGEYPGDAVAMMNRIAKATERDYRPDEVGETETKKDFGLPRITHGVASAAGLLAETLNAKMIVVASRTGATARAISNNRLFVPTVGVSDSEATLRQMCLFWGVTPLSSCPTEDPQRIFEYAVDHARNTGYLNSGDHVVMIAGTGLRVSKHNMIVVHEID